MALSPPPLAALRPFPLPPIFSPAAATARRARTAVAFSLQTNVCLLKPNRRSRRSRYPYYDLDEEDGEEFEEVEDDQGYETDVTSLVASPALQRIISTGCTVQCDTVDLC